MEYQNLSILNYLYMPNLTLVIEIEKELKSSNISFFEKISIKNFFVDSFCKDYEIVNEKLGSINCEHSFNLYLSEIKTIIFRLTEKLEESIKLFDKMFRLLNRKLSFDSYADDPIAYNIESMHVEFALEENKTYLEFGYNYSDNEVIILLFGNILHEMKKELNYLSLNINSIYYYKNEYYEKDKYSNRLNLPYNIIIPILIFCIKTKCLKNGNGEILDATKTSKLLNEHFIITGIGTEEYASGSLRKQLSLSFDNHESDIKIRKLHDFLFETYGFQLIKQKRKSI